MTWSHSGAVAVAGVGYSAIERRTGRTLGELTIEAVDRALADAGVDRAVVDALATSPSMPRYGGTRGAHEGLDVISPHPFASLLGIADQVTWIGTTGAMVTQSIIDAAAAIAAGVCTHAVVYRALHVPPGSYVEFASTHAGGAEQFTAPYGFTSPPAWMAAAMRRYFELYGYTREDLAAHIVANRENTRLNPNAYWRDTPLTREDYLHARMVSDPVSVLDCDLPVDGAVALLLTSTVRARDLRRPPAVLAGFAASTYAGSSGAPMILEELVAGAAHTGDRLWAHAGIGRDEVDVAQLYDGFGFLIHPWLEGLGFTAPGEAIAFTQAGRTRLDGELPINTGGGSLGEGRLHGMTQLAEAVAQVTDRAAGRQAAGAEVSLATVSNGLSKSTAFLFRRDA